MIQYLNYFGEQLPCMITFRVQESLFQETGLELDNPEGMKKAGLSFIVPLLYYALKAGYKADKKVFEIKREDEEYLRDILDECGTDLLSNLDKFMYAGKIVNRNDKKK